ncbi:hypothetical protein MMC30_006327 [Trapelia coarctata]|nr:hypothetical protein [Trapelia coarctata]
MLSKFDRVDDAIDANADIASRILEAALEAFGLDREPNESSMDWRGFAKPSDMDKARTTVRQLYRDWSAEGAIERECSYGPVLSDLLRLFPARDKGSLKVLLPGSGLGRLLFEVCQIGFDVEGNEISYHQLMASNWILNQLSADEHVDLYAFALTFSNHLDREHQLKCVKVPDVHPGSELDNASAGMEIHAFERMNITAADFVVLYSDEKHSKSFDAVVTVFFLDTAPNVIRYIEVVRSCLKDGGYWINLGPLLWHFEETRAPAEVDHKAKTDPSDDADMHEYEQVPHKRQKKEGIGKPGSVELTNEEVLLLLSKMGFHIEMSEVREGCGYIQDPASMMQNRAPPEPRNILALSAGATFEIFTKKEKVLFKGREPNLGFGSKRKSSSPNIVTAASTQNLTSLSPATTNGTVHTPTGSTSSTTSLPMNNQNGLGRPPSYTYNPNAPRATSPMPPGAQQTVAHHPPPINTGSYPPGHPALGGASQPPQYAGNYQQGAGVHGGPAQPSLGQYGRGTAVEVEGAGRSKAQLIVGIDFGTTFSGVAFAFATNTEAKEDIITEWPGAGTQSKQKIPTVLYYDQYQKVVGWGPDIADALAPTGYPKPGVQKVEWFKLQLMLSGNTYIDPINLPPLPPGKSEIDVAADYLFKLRQAMRHQLTKTLGDVFNREERNIRYFLTVPAIWNDAGKAATRAAAIQAGFLRDENDHRLTLITEPEAAAMFCAKTGLLNLKIRDAVLIVDCGGGTVDLIAYEVEEETPFTVAECTAGSGDSCGSTALNRNFSNILRAKIRKMKLPDGSKTAGRVYAKCIMDFENRIKADFRNNGQKWAVDVGIEAEFPDAGIEEGYMTFTNEEILQCFEPVVNRILELVRNQIIAIQAQNRMLQNVLVVGGFGASEYLFQQIKLHVPPQFQSKVVRPMDSVAAIVKGAVTAGITERVVTSRVARRHYLMATLQPFKEGHHPEQYRVPSLDGKDRCKYTRQIFVQKGQRVKIGEPVKVSFFRQVAPGATLMYEDILYACDEDVCPEYTKDPRIKEVVTLTSDLSRKNLEKDFERMDTPQGTFYRVYFDIYLTLDGSEFNAELVCQNEVMGRCTARFR